MDATFEELGLVPVLVAALQKTGITTPTEIQKKAIPIALRNQDVVGQSETGTGKTLAYLLPMFQKVDTTQRQMQAIVLVPTHELAIQIQRQVEALAVNSGMEVTATPIIGEVNIIRQIEKLKEKPHIIVGSPGRILELIQKRKLSAHTIKTIVIDEADRLLDKNNIEAVKAIIKSTLKERQLLFYSASISQNTLSVTQEIMKEPVFVKATERVAVASTISHAYVVTEHRDKIETLRKLLRSIGPKRALIFVNRSEEVEITATKLKYHGLEVEGIHSSSVKNDRKKALEDFRAGRIQCLVATDVAARGLDIQGVTHIFNLDMPEKSQDYLHRAGRTGRAGEKGTTISLVTPREIPLVRDYAKFFKIPIPAKVLYRGKFMDCIHPRSTVRKPATDKILQKTGKVVTKSREISPT
jgi:ATP-dependent RNA helicase DeaD